jgi:signal recognition particle receptor subunit beta
MYNATRKLVLKGVDGIVFVADSLKVQKEKNIESLENLKQNLAEDNIDIREIPLVLQYNKRDLGGSNIPILAVEELQEDLNNDLQLPYFTGSALKGDGVFETLREVSKMTVKYVSRKLLAR